MKSTEDPSETPPTSEPPSAGLLPRGWAKTLLILVFVILALGYLIGLRARGPDTEVPPPVRIHVAPPPEAVPD